MHPSAHFSEPTRCCSLCSLLEWRGNRIFRLHRGRSRLTHETYVLWNCTFFSRVFWIPHSFQHGDLVGYFLTSIHLNVLWTGVALLDASALGCFFASSLMSIPQTNTQISYYSRRTELNYISLYIITYKYRQLWRETYLPSCALYWRPLRHSLPHLLQVPVHHARWYHQVVLLHVVPASSWEPMTHHKAFRRVR